MEQIRNILYQGKAIGTVCMTRQGLYTLLCCRCTLPDSRIYKLQAVTERGSLSLGIPCPIEGGFGLDTRIPTGRLGQGSITFTVVCRDAPQRKLPLDPDLPFPCLSQLEHCRLLQEDGRNYVLLPEEKIG